MAEYTLTRPMWTADKTLYRAGTRQISDAHAKELGLTGESGGAADKPNGSDSNTLEGVDFASDAAREEATTRGLTREDFKGKAPSGASGFTKPDVVAIAEASK